MRRVTIFSLEVWDPTAFLNFCWPFYNRVCVKSTQKDFRGKNRWLVEKKRIFLIVNIVKFQPNVYAESTCAATCFIHFGFGHRLDNIRLLKYTFVVFYLFVYNNNNTIFFQISSTIRKKKIYRKVGDHSRGWPEVSLFDSYYSNV